MQTKLANDSSPERLRRRNRRDNEIGISRVRESADGELTAEARVSEQLREVARR